MKRFHLFIISFLFLINCDAQLDLKLYPTINSIGLQVSFPANFDTDSNARCIVRYKKSNTLYVAGFPASQIRNYSKREFRGSLFMLEAKTKYIVEVTITDSLPSLQTFTITDSISTLADPVIASTSTIKNVSPNGTGTLYTDAAPGNLKALLAAGLTCGTTVILKGGTYSTGDMQLNLLSDCSEAAPIVIKAADHEFPIIDGGDYTQYTWTKSGSDSNIYYATIKPELEYNSLCLMDSLRLYPYGFLTPPGIDPTYPCLSLLNYDLSGFYRNANLVYIKTLDHKNPNNSTIVFSKYFSCLQVLGNKHKNYIYFKGIAFKNYGKGTCTKDIFGNPTCYPSFTIDFENASDVIIDSCSFEFCNLPLAFSHACNNNIIQNCIMTDGIGRWSHGAFKQTRDESILERGTYGRYLEYSAINLFPDDTISMGNIIRNNTVIGSIGGLVGERIATYEGIEETDIYNNKVSYSYNGINADGGSLNTRIWNNEIDHCSVGVSFISALTGPNYIFRNSIHHIIERKNHHNDVFFMDCNNVLSIKIWGTGVKLNATPKTSNPPEMYFINNTFHTLDSIGFCMYLWNSTWKKLYSRNNIFYSEGLSSMFFDGPKDDSTYSFNSGNDCFYNKYNGKAATVQPTNGIPVCNTYTSGSLLGNGLKTTSTGKDVSVYNDYNVNPDFLIPNIDFHLRNTSPLIDKGIVIPGFHNQFNGAAPDIGAFETDTNMIKGIESGNSKNEADFMVYPNPSHDHIYILKSKNKNLISDEETFEIINVLGQIKLKGLLAQGTTALNVSMFPNGIYFIHTGGSTIKWIKQ